MTNIRVIQKRMGEQLAFAPRADAGGPRIEIEYRTGVNEGYVATINGGQMPGSFKTKAECRAAAQQEAKRIMDYSATSNKSPFKWRDGSPFR